jgi:hypothetical protein
MPLFMFAADNDGHHQSQTFSLCRYDIARSTSVCTHVNHYNGAHVNDMCLVYRIPSLVKIAVDDARAAGLLINHTLSWVCCMSHAYFLILLFICGSFNPYTVHLVRS